MVRDTSIQWSARSTLWTWLAVNDTGRLKPLVTDSVYVQL